MNQTRSRREFLTSTALGTAALVLPRPLCFAASTRSKLAVGEGVVDTTPPLGIEMAGFHRPAGKERRINGVRKPTTARALVLRHGDDQAAILSLDICGVSKQLTARVQKRIAGKLGIPAENVRVCATHTHSMPTFRFFRQWGAISPRYMASVEDKMVQAVELAQADLAEAELYVGKHQAPGASNNRTSKTWKTDDQFTKESSDSQRWLDTMVHVLHFRRGTGKKPILWYHFSAHPVCFRDDKAGPDWPALVDDLVHQKLKIIPSLLQGHCGDVNAGDADHWIGPAERTAEPVASAIVHAVESARSVPVDSLRQRTEQVAIPLDMKRLSEWLALYRKDPSKCTGGPWVDAGFSKDWFDSAAKWDTSKDDLFLPLSALQLGSVGLLFHPSELYSCYGLMIQRDSPLADTLVVGYTDDLIGYVPDPHAFETGEYSAVTVPKILDLPPLMPTAGQELTRVAGRLLKKLGA